MAVATEIERLHYQAAGKHYGNQVAQVNNALLTCTDMLRTTGVSASYRLAG